MKKILIMALLAITFASCKKESTASRPTSTTEPTLTYTFQSVRDGGEQRPQFTVVIVSDTSTVSKVELIRGVSSLAWEVYKPGNGTYIMYDHLAIFPTFESQAYYHFVFVKKDGSKINLPQFQVY